MSDPLVHESHPRIRNRLRRAAGHLNNVISMLEDGRPCLDIVQQLQAVESALHAAKKTLIHDHLDHCLDVAAGTAKRDGHPALHDFKAIARFL
jgi:DNA-binding FrmR family transcriptional regulator